MPSTSVGHRRRVADVGPGRFGRAAGTVDEGDGLVGGDAIDVADDHRVGALDGEQLGGGPSDPATRTGHEHHLSRRHPPAGLRDVTHI